MLLDIAIVLLAIIAAYRGKDSGFVRQFCSAVGFFGGLLIGSSLQSHTVKIAHTANNRALILVITTLICTLLGLTLGELLGLHLKLRYFRKDKDINRVDNALGSVLNVITVLITIWLMASIANGLPYAGLNTAIKNSHIITDLDKALPPAPNVIADLGHLIDPNGFPDVFIGSEPQPEQVNVPALGDLASAVNADKASVLRLRGVGCGGIISGSGFVVGPGLVATNAHVVAGIAHPYVQDSSNSYKATAIWFDPNLDFAVLRVPGLSEPSLKLATASYPRDTPAAVLGYPGGGNFNAGAAAIIDEFNAVGRNIYGDGHTERAVYEVKATIIPGNSGGPLIARDGQVMGIVFAESTTYNKVGYALTTTQVSKELAEAESRNTPVSTGSCAEE
jgi:S1-C subfamily serine protease